MAGRLVEALMTGHVRFRHELYAGASHGFAVPDTPAHDAAAADRHWTELVALFDATLR
jgi:carboxymethylenebutenolidase